MAISYPLDLPEMPELTRVEVRMLDAVALSVSPFTFETEALDWGGQMWLAEIGLPPLSRDAAAPWEAWLAALRGRLGTFLLGDPDRKAPRGSATSAAITGQTGSSSVDVVMAGTLLAADLFQLGTGTDARLHKVLKDRIGSGTLEIWPALRADYAGAAAIVTDPKGLFRLSTNERGWTYGGDAFRRISISAEEAL